MAKDTEKLIRQLSLISFLMAERRPVTASEIRQVVEGYSDMNEDAFARRFYADRAELESLGIELTVDKPLDGAAEQENYSLPPENFFLKPIEFTDDELAALGTALALLDGEFAYAEPLRLALQQISWGRPSPLGAPDQRSVALGITASAGGHDLSQRLAKIETAIFRRKTITFDYYTMERDAEGERKVDPYQLLFQGGQFYLVGSSHERKAIRVFRLSRIRGKVAYASKAEHDFQRPEDFDPREYANRIHWQFGESVGTGEVWISERVAWQVQRHFSPYGTFTEEDGGTVFCTPYASPRGLVSWVLGLGEHARILGPPELVEEYAARVERLRERHEGAFATASPAERVVREAEVADPRARGGDRRETAIRPERLARLVTLASILIAAGRGGGRVPTAELCERLQVSEQELREDLGVLNVVNFGAGAYILFAEMTADGWVDVDPDAYSDSFAKPARLLPVEAKALVSAIDLIGDHLPSGSLASVRAKVVDALGRDPVEEGLQVVPPTGEDASVAGEVSRAVADHRVLGFEYYKENEDQLQRRTVEPYALMNGREGWYLVAWDLERDAVRHFRLDRIKAATATDESFEPRPEVDPAAGIDGWPRTGEVPASRRARVWVSPDRARWAR
ncbi:MAG TPA: WYL domain-containing protein, partial [Solirubrobacteraceae bacterium]